jgi:histidine ammonia-lyase
MVVEYVVASALAELRAAAVPAAVQSVSISRGVEDDASFAALAAVQALRVTDTYRTILASELVAAVRAIRMRSLTVDGPIAELMNICAPLPDEVADRDLTDDLEVAAGLLPALARN